MILVSNEEVLPSMVMLFPPLLTFISLPLVFIAVAVLVLLSQPTFAPYSSQNSRKGMYVLELIIALLPFIISSPLSVTETSAAPSISDIEAADGTSISADAHMQSDMATDATRIPCDRLFVCFL